MSGTRIHVLGGPGAGVSTVGRQLAADLGVPYFDTDDYYWFTQDALPYKRKRNPDHRRQLLAKDLDPTASWVLGGALCGWGDVFIPLFTEIVFVDAPTLLRLARIRTREALRYGPERVGPDGDLHAVFQKFLTWAERYDQPDNETPRSLAFEQKWMQETGKPLRTILNG